MIKQISIAMLALGVASCVSAPLPPERNAASEASVRAAEEAGANNVPAARLHLQMAKDQEEESRKLASRGDGRAHMLLLRSQADAELALGIAREASVHIEATRAAEELKAVQARNVSTQQSITAPARSLP